MLTFIANGNMWNGSLAPTQAARLDKSNAEVWTKKWNSGAQNSGSRMRPGRMRTLAVMTRALNAAARARGPRSRPQPLTTRPGALIGVL